MNKIIIRKATNIDIPAIYQLVEELAEYENALSDVKVDIQYYQKEFGQKTFEAIVAEMNGDVIGTCIYYMTFSTWKGRCVYLEDFVIKKKHRKIGVGQLLYDQFIIEAKNMNATMVRWQVLDWNNPAIKFYEKNDVVFDKEWWNCKVYFEKYK